MFKKIVIFFIIWRSALFLIAFLSIYFLPTFAASFPYADRVLEITHLPYWVWGWGNFDGVHYLMIAQNGYKAFASQAFFPLYPIIVRYLSVFLPKNPALDLQIFVDPAYFIAAFITSNVLFVVALYFFYKLIRIDFNEPVANLSILFLLVYPTSYYFGSIYTESLMLFLISSSIYFIRKENFLLGGVLAALASSTKIVGLFLLPLIFIEAFLYCLKNKNNIKLLIKPIFSVIVSPLGAVFYILYLYKNFGDPFLFINAQPSFDQGRSALPVILLPQVIYRYLKIFLSVKLFSLSFFSATLEITFSLVVLCILVYFVKKIRFSYWVFTFLALIVPTMTGTFNSMPRYTLMAFLLIPLVVANIKRRNLLIIFVIFAILQSILVSMFIRGYWVS